MEFTLSREQQQVRKDTERFATTTFAKASSVSSADPESISTTFSNERWRQLSTDKLTGLHIPVSLGGRGYDSVSTAIALETLGAHCPDSGLLMSLVHHLFAPQVPIHHAGTDTQKAVYLSKLATGKAIGASTSNSGASTNYPEIQAKRTESGFVLRGTVPLCINAPIATIFIVYATVPNEQSPSTLTCFVIDSDLKGLSITPEPNKLGSPQLPVGTLILDNVLVSETAMVGITGQGQALMQTASQWERSMLSALYVGHMDRLLRSTLQEIRIRKRTGAEIGQSVSHAIADMKTRLEVSRLLAYKAAWCLQDLASGADLPGSISKTFASEALQQSTLDAIRIFERNSILEAHGLGDMVHAATDSTFFAGSSQRDRKSIAKNLNLHT